MTGGKKVIGYLHSGNSLPIILEWNRNKFLVKLKAGLSSRYSTLSEWFANRLGKLIGLRNQNPIWIDIDDTLDCAGLYIEAKDLVYRSRGINICFDFIENIEMVDASEIDQLSVTERITIFLLDVLMLNIDRTTSNTNLLMSNFQYIPTDYDSSLLFLELVEKKDLMNNQRVLVCLKSNPLYSQVKENCIDDFIREIERIDFEILLNTVPNKVFYGAKRNDILNRLNRRRKDGWYIKEVLDKLDKIELETEEQKAKRIRQNRDRFIDFINSSN